MHEALLGKLLSHCGHLFFLEWDEWYLFRELFLINFFTIILGYVATVCTFIGIMRLTKKVHNFCIFDSTEDDFDGRFLMSSASPGEEVLS